MVGARAWVNAGSALGLAGATQVASNQGTAAPTTTPSAAISVRAKVLAATSRAVVGATLCVHPRGIVVKTSTTSAGMFSIKRSVLICHECILSPRVFVGRNFNGLCSHTCRRSLRY